MHDNVFLFGVGDILARDILPRSVVLSDSACWFLRESRNFHKSTSGDPVILHDTRT